MTEMSFWWCKANKVGAHYNSKVRCRKRVKSTITYKIRKRKLIPTVIWGRSSKFLKRHLVIGIDEAICGLNTLDVVMERYDGGDMWKPYFMAVGLQQMVNWTIKYSLCTVGLH